MSLEFRLPDLGEGIHEAEILAVKISAGQTIKEDQAIFEVETDKAVVEIPSPFGAIVDAVNVEVGQLVAVGTVLATFRSVSDELVPGREVADVKPSEKSPAIGKRQTILSSAGRDNFAQTTSLSAAQKSIKSPADSGREVAAMPATRRLARELGIDLKLVNGTGSGGRILDEDVRAFAAKKLDPIGSSGQIKNLQAEMALPDFSKFGKIERVPLRSVRRKTAESMATSWAQIPHVTHCDEANLTALEKLRLKHEESVKARGGKLTLTVFVLKAVANALTRYLQFNASFDKARGEIILKHFVNIGVAVATDRGLIVPVIGNVTRKGIVELAVELAKVVDKTKSGKIELDRLQGGTFTITNVGAIGGTNMVPMINFPEAAILGMAKATLKPIVKDGKIEIGLIMPLALSFDHRIADGAQAAQFVLDIVKQLEEANSFVLEA